MGVDYRGKDMTSHPQYITVRNERGQRMLDTVKPHLQTLPTMQVTPCSPKNNLSHLPPAECPECGSIQQAQEHGEPDAEIAGWG